MEARKKSRKKDIKERRNGKKKKGRRGRKKW